MLQGVKRSEESTTGGRRQTVEAQANTGLLLPKV